MKSPFVSGRTVAKGAMRPGAGHPRGRNRRMPAAVWCAARRPGPVRRSVALTGLGHPARYLGMTGSGFALQRARRADRTATPSLRDEAAPASPGGRLAAGLGAGTTYEEWVAAGQRLARISHGVAWALGDWLLFGQRHY